METIMIINIIAILLLLAGIIYLQVKLSQCSNKWLGLIIPLICFIFSLIIVSLSNMNIPARLSYGTIVDGVVVEQREEMATGLAGQIIASSIIAFFIANIPTLLFLAIYFLCRNNMKKNKELEKMNIQDLE